MIRLTAILIFSLFASLTFGQCKTLDDLQDSNLTEENYTLFRDLFKHEKFDEALPYWEQVYKSAPALDGKRDFIYTNGIELFTYRFHNAVTQKAKRGIANFILQLYHEHRKCYPDKETIGISSEVLKLVGPGDKDSK